MRSGPVCRGIQRTGAASTTGVTASVDIASRLRTERCARIAGGAMLDEDCRDAGEIVIVDIKADSGRRAYASSTLLSDWIIRIAAMMIYRSAVPMPVWP